MLAPQNLSRYIAPRPVVRRSASSPLSAYIGLWKGSFRPDGGTGSMPFTLHQDDMLLGEQPLLAFPTRALTTLPLRVVEASATAYVAASEPYLDPSLRARVTLHITGSCRRNRLVGRYELRDDAGTALRTGTFAAVRFEPASGVNYRW